MLKSVLLLLTVERALYTVGARFTPSASFTASPWAYNVKLFILSEDGVTYAVVPRVTGSVPGQVVNPNRIQAILS